MPLAHGKPPGSRSGSFLLWFFSLAYFLFWIFFVAHHCGLEPWQNANWLLHKKILFFSNCLLSNPVLQMLSQILDLDILIPNYVCCQNAYVDFYFLFGVNSCYFSLKMHVICYSVPYAKKQTETCVQTSEWGSTYLLVNVSLLEFLLLLGDKLIQIFLIPLNL